VKNNFVSDASFKYSKQEIQRKREKAEREKVV